MSSAARARRRFLFPAAIVVFLALLFELAVRIVLPARSYEAWRSASLRYEFHPDYHWALAPGEYPSEAGVIRVNAMGLRDAGQIRPEKPAGEFRVVVLGGSSTFNYHAGPPGAWPARLEQKLADRLARPVRVINAGTPGYSTLQSSRRLESQLIQLEPDLVLVYHLWNDLKTFGIEDVDEVIKKWVAQGRRNGKATALQPSPFWDFSSAHSQAITYARFAKIEIGKRLRRSSGEGFRHPTLDREVTETGVAFYRSNLQRIADLCAKRGIDLALVDQILLPSSINSEEEKAKIRYEFVGFDPETLWRAILQARAVMHEIAASQSHVRLIETKTIPASAKHLVDHVHFTDLGLEALSSLLVEEIEGIVLETAQARE